MGSPREWESALIELVLDPERWATARLTRNDMPLPVSLRLVGGDVRVIADWPRAGPGHYRLRLVVGLEIVDTVVRVAPHKIGLAAYARMLDDLETTLPVTVAIGLQHLGGLAGVKLPPPGQTTLAQELVRLRRAVEGGGDRPGLAPVLATLARDPHVLLQGKEFWAKSERARRPPPSRLAQALARPLNLDAANQPLHVLDARVDPSPDVYENRLVKVFAQQVDLRLRRLSRILAASQRNEANDEAQRLQRLMGSARRQATFLDDVSTPTHLPTRTTMVLVKRPPYRAALEGYLELRRTVAIRLEDPALAAPLENLPRLYQLWVTLNVIAALLDVATTAGFVVATHHLVGRDGAGVYVRVLPSGVPAMVLTHPNTGTVVRLIPERTYGGHGHLRSISFQQRPDVAVEVETADGTTCLYLFDPKYKLDGELRDGESGDGKPRKEDIDKMHAYRDAIRDQDSNRVVQSAMILYPGRTQWYGQGIQALSANPGEGEGLALRLREVLAQALQADLGTSV